MTTLVILAVLLVLLAVSVSRSARRQRERMEEEQRRREQLERDGGVASPFEGMPFGGLFDTLLSGPERGLDLSSTTRKQGRKSVV